MLRTQRLLKPLDQGAADTVEAILAVGGIDCGPGRIGRAGVGEHVAHGGGVFIIAAVVLPVFRRHLPGRGGRLCQLDKAAQLFLARDVQPELDEDGSVIRQRVLELVDLLIGGDPLRRRRQSLHPFDQHAAVPTPVIDGDLPIAGNVHPEAPEPGLLLLMRAWSLGRQHLVAAGVQPLGQGADGCPLARGVPALKDEDGGAFLFVDGLCQLRKAGQHVALHALERPFGQPARLAEPVEQIEHGPDPPFRMAMVA